MKRVEFLGGLWKCHYLFTSMVLAVLLAAPAFSLGEIVINNFNKGAVDCAPKRPSRVLLKKPCLVRCIKTYHFGGGKGAKPGTISIKSEDGRLIGDWPADSENVTPVGASAPVPALWVCRPGVLLQPGAYLISDSEPSTWSCNKGSGNRGFYSITLLREPEQKSIDLATIPGIEPINKATGGESDLPPVVASATTASTTASATASMLEPKYERYVNPRFKYGIDYPGFLIAQPESENGDGRRFQSQDGESELTVYGQSAFATVDGNAWTIDTLLKDAIRNRVQDGDQITFQKQGGDWFVLSGYSGSKIFYFKAMIHDDAVKCFELKYPRKEKKAFDPIVTRVVRSFSNTQ
jgi:hypothetical protein